MSERPRLDAPRLERLRHGAVAAPSSPAVFEVTGPGALDCLQGLLTNDLVHPGPMSLVYGALLTARGAMVVDDWVLRLSERLLLVSDAAGRDASRALFGRSLPPRLARAEDRSGELAALWLYGTGLDPLLPAAGLPALPEAGRVVETERLLLARPQPGAPFRALLLGPAEQIAAAAAGCVGAGIALGDENDSEAARILAGWPRLGREIGDRTLVQEVRYDEIGGVSYTKGCYTGQETVARLHFRGHTNRELRGLIWDGTPELTGDLVVGEDGRDLGTVSSAVELPGGLLGLGVLRREAEPGELVLAGGMPARVVSLPFDAMPATA